MNLPSKDLLSEVLTDAKPIKVTYIEKVKGIPINSSQYKPLPNMLRIRYSINGYNGDFDLHINTYELIHKYKEWAYEHGYEIVSYRIQDSGEYRCLFAYTSIDLNKDKRVGFYADTELKAVDKACQWIYDQLQKETNQC